MFKRPRLAEHTPVDDGQSIMVRSAEGADIRWPREAAERAGTLKGWIEETGGEGTFPTGLRAEILRMLSAACAHDGGEATSPLASLALDDTVDLLQAANFLEATGVLTTAFNILLADKSVDELRSALGAANDLSSSEQAAASSEFAFTPSAQGEEAAAASTSSSAPTATPGEEVATPPAQAMRNLAAAATEHLHTLCQEFERRAEEMGDDAWKAFALATQERALQAWNEQSESMISSSPRRSLSDAIGDDAIASALEVADVALLVRLKAVSKEWRSRARHELCWRASCRGVGQPVPTSLAGIVELDLELLHTAGRAYDEAAAGRLLPNLARLRGFGFEVDVAAIQSADLEDEEDEDEEADDDDDDDENASPFLRGAAGTALRSCIGPQCEPSARWRRAQWRRGGRRWTRLLIC